LLVTSTTAPRRLLCKEAAVSSLLCACDAVWRGLERGKLASSGAPPRTRAAAAREAGRLAALTLTPEQAVFNRRLLVLGLAVYAGYWAEVDACIGACKEFATDRAKDGLLHLTTFYAARDAAKADAAYTGPRTWSSGPPQQWTRLHQAARAGFASRVAVLVAAGADVNARDKFGCTALSWASECGRTAVVTALLACPGVNVNVADVVGWTPLFLASCRGHTAVVAALLAHPGILVNAVTTNAATADGWTPLKVAKSNHHAEIVALLAAAGGVE